MSTPALPRPTGRVTFLFTDIEGSTRLWDVHRERMGAALHTHDGTMRAVIESHGGYVFKTIGDAFCAAFPSAQAALAAAAAAQRGLAERDWGEVGELRARIALHTGEAEERDADYFGPTVNRVARLLAAGHGGQVLLSQAVIDALGGMPGDGLAVRDLGDRRLRDLSEPERVYQLLGPGLLADFPPLATLDARPNNLPAQPTPLLGREEELAAVKERLRKAATRVLTLTGPGGTGKTRLALQAAADLIDDFAHGVWFVDLGAVTDPALVLDTIGQVLEIPDEGDLPIAEHLRAHLGERKLLLVLDNFEQLLPAAKQLAALVAGCPNLKLLVTSRAPLRITGEQEYAVPPLGVPDLRRLPEPTHLLAYPAIELFVERAIAVKHDFALTLENAPAVAEICVRLDGLPLAIELAAARVRMLPPQTMLPRLESRLKLLTGGARDRHERQQTLRGAIAWSYDLLSERERLLFERLSVFAGGATFEAAEAVCDPAGEFDLLDGLGALVEHSLVRQEETAAGEPRFRMLATIREFACEQLDTHPESRAIRLAHANYFLAFAEAGRPKLSGPEQTAWLDALQTEHDNLRLALDVFGAEGLGAEQLRLADALWGFWYYRGHLTEAANRLERALATGDAAPAATRASALEGAGVIAHSRRDDMRAVERFEAALGLFRTLGDRSGVASALDNLGMIAQRSAKPDYDAARRLFEESLSVRRKLADAHAIAVSLNNVGNLQLQLGNYERAIEYFREALEHSRDCDNRFMEALSLGNLATGIREAGDHRAASDLYGEALGILKELEDAEGIADCLAGVARIAIAAGYAGEGLRLFGAADALRDEIGMSLQAVDQAHLDEAIAGARVILGEETSAAAWAAGRAMPTEEAVALAMAIVAGASANAATVD